MCGIAGIINFNNEIIEEKRIKMMMSSMSHRGPDDNGIYINENVGLGFVRLSIIDLSPLGHQPMKSKCNRYVIIFNGEIFNYLELKIELQNAGVFFQTNTDTEVLLNAYIKWGKNCLHKFNGMWSFVIFDEIEKSIFASRDRFGIKPFYFSVNKNEFIFSSEINSILKVNNKKPEPNESAIFEYLIFNRTDQDDSTFFKDIFKLKHGHSIFIKNLDYSVEEWYNLSKNLKQPFKNPIEYKDLLIDSIKLRLRSDVPIGICFSGGIDSSSILSIIIDVLGDKDINTFSAIYNKNEKGNEIEYINIYKERIKNMHFVNPNYLSLLNDLKKFVSLHTEPIPSTSIYAQFKTMELASSKVKVTLDGQGADEQLAGYHYFFGIYFKELLKNRKIFKFLYENYLYLKIHRSFFAIKTLIFFLLPKKFRTIIKAHKIGFLTDDFYNKYINKSNISETIYNSNTLIQSLIDHFQYKLEHLLKWEDKNSMFYSIEARVPFLDHRIVEKTLSLPPEQLIKNGTTKNILRESMIDILPEKIRKRQDKIGFETPEADWFRKDEFKKLIYNLLSSESFRNRGIINPIKAKEMYNNHLSKKIDISQEIWKWINLELWFREYID
jgi:asparagine synthase (glutamine-hydrolysing)